MCAAIRPGAPYRSSCCPPTATTTARCEALDEGANDYVTKPYSTPELLARLRAVLRSSAAVGHWSNDGVLVVGDLRIDLARHTVSVGDREVDLTPKEFAFLALLARYPGPGADPSHDPAGGLGPSYGTETQYLRVYAGQIRKKLDDDMRNPRLVTELGVGYRLDERTDAPRSDQGVGKEA